MADKRRGRRMPRGAEANNFRHGHASTKTPTYHSWRAMMARCENPNNPAYERYGGRGIMVCFAWHNFAQFLHDMGERPEGTSLDRIDNDRGYESGNCRWASRRTQVHNKRAAVLVTHGGVTKSLPEWAADLGVDPSTIRYRIRKLGWSVERAVTTPPIRGRHRHAIESELRA